MKFACQQPTFQPNTSFTAGKYSLPDFEIRWHVHDVNELIMITEGFGLVSIGEYESAYKPGDIFLLGSNLPHRFQPTNNSTNAIIIHFREDCLGKDFIDLPELRSIRHIFKNAAQGLQIAGSARNQLQSLISALEASEGLHRIILFLQCLQTIADTKNLLPLHTAHAILQPEKDCLNRILNYTRESFNEQVTLSQIAAVACMSVPSFCYYFKRCTQKTYFNYLNEVRIAHACNQLLRTDKLVVDIGYESGYNTITHFHRQFLRLKKISPLQYRKQNSTQQQNAMQ